MHITLKSGLLIPFRIMLPNLARTALPKTDTAENATELVWLTIAEKVGRIGILKMHKLHPIYFLVGIALLIVGTVSNIALIAVGIGLIVLSILVGTIIGKNKQN